MLLKQLSAVLPRFARPFAIILFALTGLQTTANAQVFINEIHYDNASTDVGEAIEIAGPAGTDLTGWSLVLYNGSGGASYNTTNLSGTIVDQQGGLGTVVVNYPTNGIQNGGPDGIALVNADGAVVQFLSYEGVFAAVGGPANGLTSVDIGVAESSATQAGESLQLTGSGSFASNFTWAAAQAATFGTVNTGQTFGGGEPAVPQVVINEVDYDQPGTDSAEFIELKNVGGVPANLSEFALELVNGSGGGAAVYSTIALPDATLGIGEYFVICANATTTANCNLDVSPDSNLIQNGGPDAVALLRGALIVDVLSYEGDTAAPYTEGSGAGLFDASGDDFLGLSRSPDGTDTDINNADFALRCITPGDANSDLDTACPDPLVGPPVVINEFLADPPADSAGDANNDGTRDGSEDEFVEIVNVSGAPLDISAWTLSDAVSERHVFPGGTVLADGCGIVVFGGGAPSGGFGGALVQTASGGFLGLNNSGDTLTLSDGSSAVAVVDYGSEGGSDQSLTLSPDLSAPPYVGHRSAAGANGASYSPGERVDGSLFDGCEQPVLGPFEIYEVQGAGLASPYTGQTVIMQGNIVTAVGLEGFFIQTPTSRSDNNVDTSDGIYVFTDTAPTVVAGDLVDVTGEIIEFFDFTQVTSPAVTVTSSGLALPDAVTFDANVPSPDPAMSSCAIEFECYEGMLVTVPAGTVTGSNQRFGSDPTAEVYITAASERTFREPGLEFPGVAGIPVWDGNPEVFELDPDKLGLENRQIAAGSSFSATGVIGYEFRGYELWPTELDVVEAELPQSVRYRRSWFETTVGSLNLFRIFDDVDDAPILNALGEETDDFVASTEEYERRLAKAAGYIVHGMRSPDIIGVQEVENLKVLEDLAAEIKAINPWANYRAFLVEGNDIGGIDVGFLVRKWRFWVFDVEQMGADETYIDPSSGELDLLHDRPPLVLKGWAPGFYPLNVMVVHNRSLGGIDTERVQVKRFEQAQSIARMVQTIQSGKRPPGLAVIGDFNAFEFSDGYVDSLGHIRGDFDPAEALLSGDDLVDPNLLNQLDSLPPEERYSFIFRGNAQALDHALTNRALDFRTRGLEFARGNADAAVDLVNDDTTFLRASDHDGLVLYLYTGWQRRHR